MANIYAPVMRVLVRSSLGVGDCDADVRCREYSARGQWLAIRDNT